jgi:hypothetical protein
MKSIAAKYNDHWNLKGKFDNSQLQLQLVQKTFRLIHFYNTECFSYVAEHGGFIAQKPVPAGVARDNCHVPGHDNRDILYLTSSIIKSQCRNGIRIQCVTEVGSHHREGVRRQRRKCRNYVWKGYIHGVTNRSTILWIHTTVTTSNLTTYCMSVFPQTRFLQMYCNSCCKVISWLITDRTSISNNLLYNIHPYDFKVHSEIVPSIYIFESAVPNVTN